MAVDWTYSLDFELNNYRCVWYSHPVNQVIPQILPFHFWIYCPPLKNQLS